MHLNGIQLKRVDAVENILIVYTIANRTNGILSCFRNLGGARKHDTKKKHTTTKNPSKANHKVCTWKTCALPFSIHQIMRHAYFRPVVLLSVIVALQLVFNFVCVCFSSLLAAPLLLCGWFQCIFILVAHNHSFQLSVCRFLWTHRINGCGDTEKRGEQKKNGSTVCYEDLNTKTIGVKRRYKLRNRRYFTECVCVWIRMLYAPPPFMNLWASAPFVFLPFAIFYSLPQQKKNHKFS